MNHFPSWRYHRTLAAVIVNDPAEDEALGEGWADSPAAFLATTPDLVTEPESKADAAPKRGKRAAK